jgi:hypothetical protein
MRERTQTANLRGSAAGREGGGYGSVNWSVSQVAGLPPQCGPEFFKGQARVLSEKDVRGVTDAVEKLNRNVVHCPEDHCVVYSISSQGYYLLYRRSLDAASALALVGLDGCMESSVAHHRSQAATAVAASTHSLEANPQATSLVGESAQEQADITIIDGSLVRIFDMFLTTQNVYVMMHRITPDGNSTLVGKTLVCQNGNKTPKWDEKFSFKRVGNNNQLRLSMHCEKIIKDVYCGEAMINLEVFWQELARSTGPVTKTFPIFKKAEKTGELNIRYESVGYRSQKHSEAKRVAADAPQDAPLERTDRKRLTGSAAPPAPVTKNLRQMLNRPEELHERLRQIFYRIARVDMTSSGSFGKFLEQQDMAAVGDALSKELDLQHAGVFGDLTTLFWRYNFSENPVLDEKEAVMCMGSMIMRYRDAISPPTALKLDIRERQVGDAYELGKELGRGGQAIVHIAKQKDSGRQVVLKMYGKGDPDMPAEEINQEFETGDGNCEMERLLAPPSSSAFISSAM